MSHWKEKAVICSQEQIAEGIYDLWLQTDSIAADAMPGQFISCYCRDASRLLPRPISICEINKNENRLRIVYRIAGAGTKEFSGLKPGDFIELLGPLGNGFPLEAGEGKKSLIIGGGIGIPPMLELAKQLRGIKQAVLGYRDSDCFLADEIGQYAKVSIASGDGSIGVKGTVLNAMKELVLEAEVIYACGPAKMLRAVKQYAGMKGILAYLSLEERMACGIGACLACVCNSKQVDSHTNVANKRVCKEGPVFEANEIQFDGEE